MSITDKNSVLILGAGVSLPFGLPLGGGMMDMICKNLTDEIDFINNDENDGYWERERIKDAAASCRGFEKTPIYGTVSSKYASPNINRFDSTLDNEHNKLGQLANLLRNQTSETIDDFIVENPSFAELTKIAIASSFISSLYEKKENQIYMSLRSLDAREVSRSLKNENPISERNWIHLLINIVRHGIREGSVTSKNKVKIITFNYDQILEHVLEKQFSNTEKGKEYKHYTEYFKIIHVHGKCGELKERIFEPAQTCWKWGKGIHVVNEFNVPENIKNARKEAASIIQDASEIYACGFSFSGPNCRLLKIGTPRAKAKERTISYCNYDGNIGLHKAVEKYKMEQEDLPSGLVSFGNPEKDTFTKIEEISGTLEKPIGVVDWLRLGSLGELPG